MNAIFDGIALWLADFHLVATALLLGVLAALAVVKQPARRMAVVKATLGALAGLAVLCALPGWSAVHLFTDRQAPPSEAIADRLEKVPAEQSATQLIPHLNVDQIPSPQPERQVVSQSESAPASQQSFEAVSWVRVALIAHAAGSAMVVAWLMAGAVMARRIRRGAVAASAELHLALERIAGPSSAPRLLASSQVATPVAMGVFDSTIILPSAMVGAGDAAPLAPILAHELAHVRNGDLHSLALSRLLLVLLWPQPLYWWLRRSLRLDQEALADAAAAEVAGRVEYAERLVGWARNQDRGHKAPRLAGAVGLWEGPSQLKRRVALLLDEKFAVMRNCSRRWRGACFGAMALAAVGLSLVTLQPAIKAEEKKANAPDVKTGVTEASATQHTIQGGPGTFSAVRVGPPATDSPYKKNAFVVQAVDGAGKPLASVEATLYRVSYLEGTHEVMKTATTNDEGEVEFADLVGAEEIAVFAAIEQAKEFPPNSVGQFLVSLKAPGLATMTVAKGRFDTALHGAHQEVIMRPAAELRGRIVDKNGTPVSGATVTAGRWGGALSIKGVNAVASDDVGEFVLADLVAFDEQAAANQQQLNMRDAAWAYKKEDGVVFKPVDAAEEPAVSRLTVTHPDFAVASANGGNVPGTTTVTLAPAAVISGRVLDFDTGEPAGEVSVVASGMLPATESEAASAIPLNVSNHTAKTRTDARGRYQFKNLPAANYDVWAQPATQDWKDAEWVSQAVGPVEAKAGAAVDAPDLAIGPGGVVRGQLMDGATGEALKPSDERATVRIVQEPVEGAPRQYGLNQNVPVAADGSFVARVFPGKSRLHVNVSLDGKSQPYSKIDYMSQGPGVAAAAVLDVKHGEQVDERFVVYSMEAISQQQVEQSKAVKLLQEGKHEEAIATFDAIIADQPEDGSVRYGRSIALERTGRLAEAVADLEHLLAGGSNDAVLLNNLASILATAPDAELRDGRRAVELANRAVQEMRKQPYRAREVYNTLDTLSSAYAETGDFEKAIATQREAIEIAPTEEKEELGAKLKLYEDGKPYRRPAPAKKEKPSSSSSGGLEAKDWASKTTFNSPAEWWLVRSAVADADVGRATLGMNVADVGFAAPLDYGDKLTLTIHPPPEDDNPRWIATPLSAPVM